MEVAERPVAAPRRRPMVPVPRIEAIIHVPIETTRSMEPRPRTDKQPAGEPVWPIVAVRRAIVWRIVVVPVRAHRRHADANNNLRRSYTVASQQPNTQCRNSENLPAGHTFTSSLWLTIEVPPGKAESDCSLRSRGLRHLTRFDPSRRSTPAMLAKDEPAACCQARWLGMLSCNCRSSAWLEPTRAKQLARTLMGNPARHTGAELTVLSTSCSQCGAKSAGKKASAGPPRSPATKPRDQWARSRQALMGFAASR
jgi:hypothetical protein